MKEHLKLDLLHGYDECYQVSHNCAYCIEFGGKNRFIKSAQVGRTFVGRRIFLKGVQSKNSVYKILTGFYVYELQLNAEMLKKIF